MIARLRGLLDLAAADHAVIDVGGIGYLVFASARTLAALGPAGSPADLLIDTHMREDHIQLFGFISEAERRCFRELQTVQGVGAKAALAVLSALAPEALAQAVAARDRAMLTRADGIGPRLAGRIINELKDRPLAAAAFPPDRSDGADGAGAMQTLPGNGDHVAVRDAVSALVNLGYGRGEALAAVTAAARTEGEGAPVDRLITHGLRVLAPGVPTPGVPAP